MKKIRRQRGKDDYTCRYPARILRTYFKRAGGEQAGKKVTAFFHPSYHLITI